MSQPEPGKSSGDARAAVRSRLFGHLSGLVLAPTVSALWERGTVDLLTRTTGPMMFRDIIEQTRANPGYMHVALRLLAACGWLVERPCGNGSHSYTVTDQGRAALAVAPPLYSQVTSAFLSRALAIEEFLERPADLAFVRAAGQLIERAQAGWGLSEANASGLDGALVTCIRTHLEGTIVGPAMVALARSGVLAQLEQSPIELGTLGSKAAATACLLELIETAGWVERTGDTVALTGAGRYAVQIASAYGVTVSYLPMFAVVSTLLFGNPRIPRVDASGFETMVNRAMNVWGSGGAHTTYFKKLDEIIVELFNRPLAEQPRGICDMGCGDGTLLAHLYGVVKDHTARGKVLDQHPLLIVGADFNKVARRVSKQTLRAARIPTPHVIPGDINRPAQLASDLEELDLDVHDLLHIRSFLDHNRPYVPLANYTNGSRTASTTGAFAYLGDDIAADELEENLVRHIRRWKPYVGRFGLLVLELHTLPPALTAANLDRTPAVAYDATHGFSDQYLVELPVFIQCAREAGLQPDERWQAKFPPSELATVSLNYFTAA